VLSVTVNEVVNETHFFDTVKAQYKDFIAYNLLYKNTPYTSISLITNVLYIFISVYKC